MIHIVLITLTVLLVVASVFPFIPVPHGLFRVADFPRVQKIGLLLILAVATAICVEGPALRWGLVGVQLVAAISILPAIAPYTPLWPVQAHAFTGDRDAVDTLSVLTFNVKMSNRATGRLLDLVQARSPDIIVLVETDEAWAQALAPLAEGWPHGLEQPLDNGYGMIVRSRLPLHEARILERMLPRVPSMSMAVQLRSGRKIRLHAVHPEPPVPHVDTVGRDGEILMVGKEVVNDRMPAIVTGDLNDVAWSHTTRRFQRLTKLLDPRVGRGFYNSFDTRFPLLRWPLDHLFHSAEFEVIELARLPNIGSDHYPMYFELAVVGADNANGEPPPADATDLAEAKDVLACAEQLDRDPIGEDWES